MEGQRELYFLFDFQKVYDRVLREGLWLLWLGLGMSCSLGLFSSLFSWFGLLFLSSLSSDHVLERKSERPD